MNIFPYRVRFEKTGRMRFLSHHDLMRLFERALRRTGLPLRMTEGFNPHPIQSFPTALGVGIESLDEVMEFELTAWTPPPKIQQILQSQLPEGIRVTRIEAYSRPERSAVDYVEYEAILPAPRPDLAERIAELMARKEVVVERRSDKGSKPVEIRRYLLALEAAADKLLMRIQVTDAGTARPEEVLRALEIDLTPDVRLRKTYTEVVTR